MDLGAIPQGGAVEESGGMETSSGGGDGVAIEINDVDEEDDDDVEVTSSSDVSLEEGNSHDKEIVNSLPLTELGVSGRHPSAVNTDDVVTAEESRTRLMDNAICLSRGKDESLDDNSMPRGDPASGTMIIHHSREREGARCIYDASSPPIKDDNPPDSDPPDGGAGDWRQSVARSSRSGEIRSIADALASLEPGGTSASKLALADKFEDSIFKSAYRPRRLPKDDA